MNYVVDAGGSVAIPAIPAPQPRFKSAEEAVKLSLDWEVTVTKQINGLVDLAIAENDHTSRNFLQWFVAEQLEEVSSMDMLSAWSAAPASRDFCSSRSSSRGTRACP